MKAKQFVILALLVVLLIILAACGGAPAAEPEVYGELPPREEPAAPAVPAVGMDMAGAPAPAEQESAKSGALPGGVGVEYSTLPDVSPIQGRTDRLIIKNADVSILVEDSDVAIDRLTQVVSDVGGYIEYYGENYKYASVTIGVPVDQFELAMRRTRGLAMRVLDENAAGEDVTEQFVDMESRLKNLEATRDRIQSFLADAKTVDEALRINQELAAIEAQIEEVKGRMNYLADRSAYSTITVTVSPELPEIVEPTPTPSPTPAPWSPADTLEDATDTLVKSYQGIVEFAIWLFVAVLPILVPPALVIWLLVKLLRRKPVRGSSPEE